MKLSEILTENKDKKKHQRAYDRGAEDAEMWISTYGQHHDRQHCPYEEDSEEAQHWKRGWHDSYHANFPDGDD